MENIKFEQFGRFGLTQIKGISRTMLSLIDGLGRSIEENSEEFFRFFQKMGGISSETIQHLSTKQNETEDRIEELISLLSVSTHSNHISRILNDPSKYFENLMSEYVPKKGESETSEMQFLSRDHIVKKMLEMRKINENEKMVLLSKNEIQTSKDKMKSYLLRILKVLGLDHILSNYDEAFNLLETQFANENDSVINLSENQFKNIIIIIYKKKNKDSKDNYSTEREFIISKNDDGSCLLTSKIEIKEKLIKYFNFIEDVRFEERNETLIKSKKEKKSRNQRSKSKIQKKKKQKIQNTVI